MASPKRITDLKEYQSILPYSSEMFGVYQPLIGWKSKRIKERFDKGLKKDKSDLLKQLSDEYVSKIKIKSLDGASIDFDIEPGKIKSSEFKGFDSLMMQHIATSLPDHSDYKPELWEQILTPEKIQETIKNNVVPIYKKTFSSFMQHSEEDVRIDVLRAGNVSKLNNQSIKEAAFKKQLEHESAVAGALLNLVKNKNHAILEDLFYSTKNNKERIAKTNTILNAKSSAEAYLNIENLNPREQDHINSVALSPISVVHLFRQYFFELDTFLGTPVNHVWLSPGSSVELVETHTRRTVTEKTLETTLDTFIKSESSSTDRDEISDAVKDNNEQDIKFGASVTASYMSVEASSSFDYNSSQQTARENTHKRMREQTEKLSSEIRKNFKSTFKQITEFTDVSSTKHIMANKTDELINYELRRKMRQVGVQVQDIGTYLCWQTYVDNPGKELELSKLIHIAKSPDLDTLPHPEAIPLLQPFKESRRVTIPFISVLNDADNEDEVYKDGVEVDNSEFLGSLEKIKADFKFEFVCPKPEYTLSNVEYDAQGQPVKLSTNGKLTTTGNNASVSVHLDSVDFQGRNGIDVGLILHWSPNEAANEKIRLENESNLSSFKEAERAAYEKAYVENVRDRVNVCSKITTRKSEDLREEERIVVYRRLIQDMLLNGVPMPDDNSRHVVSELLNSIFDIDKMLYFVAPEWWRPRHLKGRQPLDQRKTVSKPHLGEMVNTDMLATALSFHSTGMTSADTTKAMSTNTVGFNDLNDGRGNYFITEDSEPAKFGSSLGWLLQLDGDNMRNAFLNAPWVKAVIPIRPGKEEAAINWLKGVEGMNGINDDAIYQTDNPNEKDSNGNPYNGQKMIDVLMDLAKKIKKKYFEGIKTGKYPEQSELADPELVDEENTVTATPIDRVYEHGFFPLESSFRANVGKNYEIFDQWIEILPTDQIVPVEVKYDPKTGRQM